MPTTVTLRTTAHGVARIVFSSDKGIQLLSRAVGDELRTIVKQLEHDETIRVIVIEAEGKTFLAGADLHELLGLTRKSARKYSRDGQRLFERIAGLPAVTICAIHAACAGGGCELALACDVRLAAASARIGLPEVTLGLIPGWGGTARATLRLGPSVARRIILTGELLPAAEAVRIGLVDAVFPDDQFRLQVDERVTQFLKAGPRAAATAKRFIREIESVELRDLLDIEADEFARCYASGEPAEGLAAFLEKRATSWAGGA